MELVDWWGDLQAGLQNGLLPLQTDILGPTHEAAQVPLGLDVLSDLEAARTSNEKRVLHSLHFGLFNSQGSGCDLLSLLLGLMQMSVNGGSDD